MVPKTSTQVTSSLPFDLATLGVAGGISLPPLAEEVMKKKQLRVPDDGSHNCGRASHCGTSDFPRGPEAFTISIRVKCDDEKTDISAIMD